LGGLQEGPEVPEVGVGGAGGDMAIELVELGAIELIEIGRVSRLGQFTSSGLDPVGQLYNMVEYLEDPTRGVSLEPGESISPRQRAIAERLKTISRAQRRALVRGYTTIEGFSVSDMMAESNRLGVILNELGLEFYYDELGKLKLKKIGKRIKKVAKKVAKVVKHPAFISAVGLAANFIPGAGQAISAGMMALAAARAKKLQAKAAKKGETVDYGTQIVGDIAPALAMSQAVGALGIGQEGSSALFDSLPKPVQAAAEKLMPGITNQINTVGQEDFLATALKALGQSGAIGNLVNGVGSQLPGGVQEILGKIGIELPEAGKAGEQDIKNDAAMFGASNLVQDAMDAGKDKFPVVPVVIGISAAAILAVTIAVVAR